MTGRVGQDRQLATGLRGDENHRDSAVNLLAYRTQAGADASDSGTRYRIRTKEQDIDKVGQIVNDSLTKVGFDLRRVTVEPGEIVDLSQPDAKPAGRSSRKNPRTGSAA